MSWATNHSRNHRFKDYSFKSAPSRVFKKQRAEGPFRHAHTFLVWWEHRLQAGQQLTNLVHYQEGFDYKRGQQGSWLPEVTLEALRKDYMTSLKRGVNVGQFNSMMRKALAQTKVRARYTWEKDRFGVNFLRVRRYWVRFERLTHYQKKEHDNEANNAE